VSKPMLLILTALALLLFSCGSDTPTDARGAAADTLELDDALRCDSVALQPDGLLLCVQKARPSLVCRAIPRRDGRGMITVCRAPVLRLP
jgi:hypothetical protein